MKTNFLPSCLLAAGMLLTGNSVFAQTTTSPSGATYTDGNPDGYAISIGQTYRFNLGYAHSYVGFNVKPLSNGQWNIGSDGGSNGGAMITGNMGGSLQFITVPTNPAAPGARSLYDSDLNGLTRMVINRDGQVKIGATQPGGIHADFKLSVDGKIVAKSVYVTSQNWADFVFEPTYKRMALPALEQYLQTNKHLPNVPSAKEVETNGYSLGEMDAKLLQSVEELTLHVIELNKYTTELSKRNERLEGELVTLRQQMAHQAVGAQK